MKVLLTTCFIFCMGCIAAQRPATKAEHDEDARVLQIIASSMPKDIAEAPDPEERSNNGIGGNSSDLTGISGFHNNMNFATRNTFEHYYKADYNFKKIPEELSDELTPIINQARDKTDMASLEILYKLSNCTIIVSVNQYSTGNEIHSFYPITAFKSPYSNVAYRDSKGYETILFFGACKPVLSSEDGEAPDGKPRKTFMVADKAKLQIGTVIQTIAISIDAHPAIAAYMLKHMNVEKIKALLGTGKFTDDESESELKKYFVEKNVSPVAGANTLSFTYIDKDGNEKLFSITSSKHDLSNCALLRNHNENPKVMQEAHIDLSIQDDKDPNKLFTISLPIIRTTGTVTATFDSDYDYQVMWRGNPDVNHSFSPTDIVIHLLKWAPAGDFLEGTFSGEATLKDHNDFSTEKPSFTIKNGKFRIRRIPDQMK